MYNFDYKWSTQNSWEEHATIISKRAYPAAIKYNDILHIFGGYDYDHDILKTSETINPDGQAKVEGHFNFKSYDLY